MFGLSLAGGLLLRSWGLTWGLYGADVMRRPHPDEWVVYWLFRWFGQGHSLNPCSPYRPSCFFDWGTVYPYTAFAVHKLLTLFLDPGTLRNAFGAAADPTFVGAVLAGRATSIACSMATIVVVYLLGREVYSHRAGAIAACAIAFSALPIQLAHFATPDSLTTLLVSLELLLLVIILRNNSATLWAGAGIVAGLAAGTGYHMPLLAVPFIYALLQARTHLRRSASLWVGGAVLAYAISNVYVFVNWSLFLAALHHSFLIRTVDSGAQYQGRFDAYGPWYLYVVRYSLTYGVGLLFCAWFLLGVVFAAVKRTPAQFVLLAWLLPYFVLDSLSAAKFARYSLPLLPVLVVFAGGLADYIPHSLPRLSGPISVALLALLVVPTAIYGSAYAGLFTDSEPRYTTGQWIQNHLRPGTRVGFEQLPNGLVNLPYFTASRGFVSCFAQFHAARLSGPMRFFASDNYGLEEHPRVPSSSVTQLQMALQNTKSFTRVMYVHLSPTLFGLTFPIDNSPHDWRYMTHAISVYRRNSQNLSAAAPCFRNLTQADAAIGPPHAGT